MNNLPTSKDDVVFWLLCGLVTLLLIIVGSFLKGIAGRALSLSTSMDELRTSVKLLIQAQENQKNWGIDLEELKITTKLILQTQNTQSNRVDILDKENRHITSRIHSVVDKINEIIILLDMLRRSGCSPDCNLSKQIEYYVNKDTPIEKLSN